MDIKYREKKIISLCDSTRDYTPDLDNSRNIKTEENKIEIIESNQRRTRKDMNCTKDRYKTNSYNRDCKPKKNMKNLKLKKEDLISEPQKKTSPENNYDDEKVSQVVDEALKEIYSSDSKLSQSNLKRMRSKIKYHVENKKNMPEIMLETLINKLSSIMENEKESVIEKHCSKQLICILKNNSKNLNLKPGKKNKKEVNPEDFEDKNFFMNFWNKYKKEIDDVINQLNQLYSILLNSVKEITYVFEYPFKMIEKERTGTKINIETFIKDKFFDIICNDELIKTLIQEIKKSQKNKNNDTSKQDLDSDRNKDFADICQTHNTHSTCDDNEEVSDEINEDNENSENSQQANKEVEKENNIRDLNEWVDYIMEDDEKEKNLSKKKKNLKTSQKKKKKSKKNIENTEILTKTQVDEEDKIITEFKIKLENDSLNAKEVYKKNYHRSKK